MPKKTGIHWQYISSFFSSFEKYLGRGSDEFDEGLEQSSMAKMETLREELADFRLHVVLW
jgi:hypothetical protein